jgi:hypothetical protein
VLLLKTSIFSGKKTSEPYFSIGASSNRTHGTAIEQFLLLLPETRFIKTWKYFQTHLGCVVKKRAATAAWRQAESSSTLESHPVPMYDHIHATEIILQNRFLTSKATTCAYELPVHEFPS